LIVQQIRVTQIIVAWFFKSHERQTERVKNKKSTLSCIIRFGIVMRIT